MRKIFKYVISILLVGFIAMQFFQPPSNTSDDISGLITEQVQMPSDIKLIFENACLNCHSNNTNYWWYNKVSPASWLINDHIIEGKEELNLSEWGEMDIYDKIGTLEDIAEEVSRKEMPLKSYSLVHREAKLSDEQIKKFVDWTENYSAELLKSLED